MIEPRIGRDDHPRPVVSGESALIEGPGARGRPQQRRRSAARALLPTRAQARFAALVVFLARFVVVELAILASMVMICIQVLQSRDVMQRVIYGTLQLPKFLLHFVPLLVSAMATIVFAIEAVTKHERA